MAERIFYLIPILRPGINARKIFKNVTRLNAEYFYKIIKGPNQPIGGIKTCYNHCELLNSLGYYARPLFDGVLKIDWFEIRVKALDINEVGYDLNDRDVVVCPEIIPYEGLKFKNAKKIMLVLNWIGTTGERPFLKYEDLSTSYEELGYEKIITNSEYTKKYLKEHNKGDAVVISGGIDHDKFIYKPEAKEENRILFLPRKNHYDAKKIINDVKKQFPHAKFDKADALTEREIIKAYQKADIFLATGYPEGFPRPPLEAMACGCAVVGFAGGGGEEYMEDGKTAMVARDGDTDTAARKLINLLKDKNLKEKVRLAGNKKSKEYSMDRMKQDLRKFYESI